MIQIDPDNLFKGQIGLLNGVGKRVFSSMCERNQSLVKAVFKNKKKLGYNFLELPDDATLVRKIKRFATAQKKHKWENVVVLGIGGSSLGLIAIQESILGPLHNLKNKPRLFVVDNIDPAYTAELFDMLDFKKTLFVVISKSGSTTEPMVLYGLVKERLQKQFPKTYQKHLVFITDPKGGLLRPIAKKEGITAFEVPEKVGGRFSVLSAVGLLPAALVGVDIAALLRGAKQMREEIKKKKGVENPALLLAQAQFFFDRKRRKNMTVMMPYSNALFRMGDWYRQLLAESIGKNKRTGPTPINALGATDQHSQLQLYNAGPNNKLFFFLTVKNPVQNLTVGKAVLPEEIGFLNGKKMSTVMYASYAGTAGALAKNGRPNLTLQVEKVDEAHVGGLFMLFEFQVALLGLLYKINAFNQPGVEESKVLTKKILSGN